MEIMPESVSDRRQIGSENAARACTLTAQVFHLIDFI
jgi:hypothetical protein